MKWLMVCISFACVVVPSERAMAELFRCTTHEGKVIFTDRENACSGAEPYKADVELQRYEPSPAALAPQVQGTGSKQRGLEAKTNAGAWREKKTTAQQKLTSLEGKWDYLNQYITHCNRQGKILAENDAGLRYEVSCENIREEYAEVKTALEGIRAYLDKGLAEECRRAGCLPGWVR